MNQQHRSCTCGAVYRRTESVAQAREVKSFECLFCDEVLEQRVGANLSARYRTGGESGALD
jgi:hypothetical protein